MTEAGGRRPRTCPVCGTLYEDTREGDVCDRDGGVLLTEAALDLLNTSPYLGQMIAGKYAVVGIIGAGGFGSVYRAVQHPVRRPVAVKVIKRSGVNEEQRRTRFFREARLVANLRDPSNVTLHDYGEDVDGTVYMVFELVHGITLEQAISQGPMQPSRAAGVMVQVLRGLAEAHRNGVLHRDLKPANVMVLDDALGGETVKVLDYGIAKAWAGTEGSLSDITADDVVVGTPRYMAPEQVRNDPLDQRTDIYAAGVLLYALLAGKPPFNGDSAMTVLVKHLQEPPPDFSGELMVPQSLDKVVRKALEKAPDDRYPSAEAMARALMEAAPSVHTTGSGVRPLPSPSERRAALDETLEGDSGLNPSLVLAGEQLPSTETSRRHPVALLAVVGLVVLGWLAMGRGTGDPPAVDSLPISAGAPAAAPDAAKPDAAKPDAAKPDAAKPDATPEPARPAVIPRERPKPAARPAPPPPATPAKPPEALEVPEF